MQKYWIHQFNILFCDLCFVSLLPVAFQLVTGFPHWSNITLPHSSLHNSSNCLIFCGSHLWTLTFKVFHKFRRRTWIQLRVLTPLFSNHSFVSFVICLGSLSCGSTKIRPSPKEVADFWRFFYRISLYMLPFILPWITCNSPVPLDEKHLHIIMKPSPNITVGMVLCFLKAVPFFSPKTCRCVPSE